MGPPIFKQVTHDRVELLLRRIPGLQQIVVKSHFVDRADGSVLVGIRGQQDPAGVREDLGRFGQELDSSHARHALVHHEEGHCLVSPSHLPQLLQGRFAALRGDDLVVAAVLVAQVPRDGAKNRSVVVERQDYGSLHGPSGLRFAEQEGGFGQENPSPERPASATLDAAAAPSSIPCQLRSTGGAARTSPQGCRARK